LCGFSKSYKTKETLKNSLVSVKIQDEFVIFLPHLALVL